MIDRRTLFGLGSVAAVWLATGCTPGGSPSDSPSPSGSSAASPSGRGPMLSIAQGTVGSVGAARVGYVGRDAGADRVSIWRDGDESGLESSVGLGDGEWAFIGGECWRTSRLEARNGRTFVGFDPVLTRVASPPDEAGLLYVARDGDDTAAIARVGTLNRLQVTELTARTAVLRHWKGVYRPEEPGERTVLRVGSVITMGKVSLTVTRLQPTLDRLRGFVQVEGKRSR